jgi:hypothetical protein
MSGEWWGFIFLMLVMKVPIAYLAGVVWYACKPPDPPEPARMLVEAPEHAPDCPWQLRRREPDRPRRPRPPAHRLRSSPRIASAYARRR